MRLWPIGAFALVVGIAGWFAPQVAAIGAGYAILIALAWRGRENAVAAIEERDGVRFYVEPSSALRAGEADPHARPLPRPRPLGQATPAAARRGRVSGRARRARGPRAGR